MMYVVTYDQNRFWHNYEPLYQQIQTLGPWWKHMDRTWIVCTRLSVQQVTDLLTPHLGEQDRMLITRLVMPFQGWLPQPAYDWIREQWPQWGEPYRYQPGY